MIELLNDIFLLKFFFVSSTIIYEYVKRMLFIFSYLMKKIDDGRINNVSISGLTDH